MTRPRRFPSPVPYVVLVLAIALTITFSLVVSELDDSFRRFALLAAGVAVALLLYALTHSLMRARHALVEREAAAALQNQERLSGTHRFRAFVTATTSVVWTADAAGNFVESQPSWEAFTHLPRGRYLGGSWVDWVHADDRAAAAESWQRAIAQREPIRVHCRLPDHRGEYRHVELRAAPIVDAHGEVEEWVGTVGDIHAQREAEEELAYQTHLLRTLTDSTTTCLILMDERGYPTYLNQAAKNVTGYASIDEIGNRPLHESLHEGESKEFGLTHVRDQEDVFVRKDGSTFPVVFSLVPLERRGRPVGAVIEVRDVTEEKAAEQAVREASERFKFLAESVPQKMFTAAADGTIDYLNRQWLEYTGRTVEEMRAAWWSDFVHPDDTREDERRWRHAIAFGQPFEMEHRFRRADGTYRWHLTRAHAMRDESGGVVMWVGSNTDIEDQKQASKTLERLYREAEAANRTKDDFLATVSHELRTPMTAILGWSRLLASGDYDASILSEAVATIQRSAKAQAQLIDDMLDVSRIATGKLHLNLENIAVAPILSDAIRAASPAAEAKQIEIHRSFEQSVPDVRADATRLQQVYWNLLSNAVKFTPQGGRVDVRLSGSEGAVVVEVSDSGRGIKEEFLPHVFDRFRQEETSTTRHYSGLGLGLSIVKQLVEMHGGVVTAKSGGEGSGATFRVSLPGRELATEEQPVLPFRAAVKPNITGARVLIVDDEADVRRVVAAILEKNGATVRSASTAAEALEQLHEGVDVVISDIAMPDADGYFLLATLRASASWKEMPAIALTAYGRPVDAEQSLAAGFRTHLVKPVEPNKLVQAVADAMA